METDGDRISVGRPSKELTSSLTSYGREWGVDVIVIIQPTRASDWIGSTPLSVEGYGIYSRRGTAAYCVLRARMFRVKDSRFIKESHVRQAHALPAIPWRYSWDDYSPEEKRAIDRTLTATLADGVRTVLGKFDMTDEEIEESAKPYYLGGPKTYLPEGNELEVPVGVSIQQARHAVVAGFERRKWVVTEKSEERIVGVYRKGRNEATCVVTFDDGLVVLSPEGHRVHADGRRERVKPFARWHRNLKRAIVVELARAPSDGEAP